MEDKYFNEFFDKLYNGKLNIYEDEEEETSEEDVDKVEIKDDEINNDDNEQNYIIPENPNQSSFLSKPTINDINVIKNNNYSEFNIDFKKRQLNGFWELYDMESNQKKEPAWRKYIINDEGFKEYIKTYIEDIYPEFKKRLKELYYQSLFNVDSDIEKIYNKDYNELGPDFRKRLNGFWELYDIENNGKDIPYWRKFIRKEGNHIEGFKEYIKSFIKNEYPEINIEERLIELYYQALFLNKPTIEGINVIKNNNNNYSDFNYGFRRAPLNGFWELYGFESNNYKNPTWRKYIRKGDDYIEGFKKYIKSFLEKKYPNFEERLNELFEQKGEGYEKTFTKEYDGKKYFEKINIPNESIIHNLNPEEINISGIINNYVNSQIENNPEYLTTELTDGDINYIKDNLVDPVYNNIINYLGNDENKVVSYDLKCEKDLIDNKKNKIIKSGQTIEVKDILKLDSYYSEYIASPVKTSTYIKTPKGKEIYKVFVENLLEKIKNDSSGTFDKIINDVYGNISGMIIANDIYVPKENITLYISSRGQGYGRITLRYNINPNEGNFYKIEKPEDNKDDGKVNKPLKIRELKSTEKSKLKPMGYVNPIYPKQGNVGESYDSYLDQLVENFFNTGKFFS